MLCFFLKRQAFTRGPYASNIVANLELSGAWCHDTLAHLRPTGGDPGVDRPQNDFAVAS